MALIIMYPSALEYWLEEKGIPYSISSKTVLNRDYSMESLLENCSRKEVSSLLEYLNFSMPVHVGIPAGIRRYNTDKVIAHRLPAQLAPESFIQVADSIYLSSPEMCFLQAAVGIPLEDLVNLACDLCAIYVKDPYESLGQRRREVVTTTESIADFLDKAGGCHGVKNAKRAIQYALNRSNSPVESKLATIAMLPISSGGYGLIRPELNYDVPLSKDGTEYLKQKTCCCDMVWPEQRIVLEYDSNLSHMDVLQIYKDKRRSTALSFSDYKTISVTADQVQSFRTIEGLFLKIRNALNMRTHPERMEKYFEKRWDVVHHIMLDYKNALFVKNK